MAVEIKYKGYSSFYNFLFLNWIVAFFVYLKKGRRNEILLFRSLLSGTYERVIYYRFVRHISGVRCSVLVLGG